eukprot:5355735-Prorocentrum_lima.AAC.1
MIRVEEQAARYEEHKLCQKLIGNELKQMDEAHQTTMKSGIGLLQQQLALATENLENRAR